MWRWGLKFLANCTAEKARINTERKARLCLYSQRKLREVADETGIDYHATRKGALFLYREQDALERAAGRIRILQDNGMDLRTLDAAATVAVEPALADAQGSSPARSSPPTTRAAILASSPASSPSAWSGRGTTSTTAPRSTGSAPSPAASSASRPRPG